MKSKIVLFKKINAFLICLFVVALSNKYIIADSVQDAKDEYEKILKEQQEAISKKKGVEKEIDEAMYELTELDQKVTEAVKSLKEIESKYESSKKNLEEKQNDLQNVAQKYNSAKELYETRIKILYEKGVPSMLEIFLSSKNITDFFAKANVLNSILEYDQKLVSNLKSQKEYTDYIKKDIETQTIQLEQLKYDKEKTAQTLELAVKAKETKIDQLNTNKINLEKQTQMLESQKLAAKKKMEEEILKSNYIGNFKGEFTWPAPGNFKITAMFYDKEYYDRFRSKHTGTDVGVSTGTKLVAAATGKVVISAYNSGGYGNYIVIDHGTIDGTKYATLYAHLSSRNVNKGDLVGKGELIGYSGNSGNSTGPHLHFEVIKTVNRTLKSIDAMDYFIGSGAPFTYNSYSKWIEYPFLNSSKYQYGKILNSYISY